MTVWRKAALAAAAVSVWVLPMLAQAPAGRQGGAPQGPAQGQAPARGGFGGGGNIKVLLVTKGHPFDREPFFLTFDQPPVGASARWTHAEQPVAEVFFDPALAKDYDVFVFYDMNGYTPDRRKASMDKTGKPVLNKDGSPSFTWEAPPADVQANLKALPGSLAAGGPGMCGTIANVCPEFTVEYLKAFAAGECERAEVLFRQLVVMHDLMIGNNYPASAKYILNKRGLPLGWVTRTNPGKPLSAENMAALDALLAEYDFKTPAISAERAEHFKVEIALPSGKAD